ncbi:terminase small subunit [Streptococcus phage SG586P1]|nr:terminase small subunit [Streptococcus phage SG586P1]WAX18041.1 terminase small subunit [Streptococcus phage SG586P3]
MMKYEEQIKRLEEEMTDQEIKFANEYLANGYNVTKAYETIGTSKSRGAMYQAGARIKRKPRVKQYLELKFNRMINEQEVTAQDIVKRLVDIAFARPQDGIKTEFDNIENVVKEDKSYSYTPSQDSQLKALEMLGKNLKMFTDKIETDVNIESVVFKDDID